MLYLHGIPLPMETGGQPALVINRENREKEEQILERINKKLLGKWSIDILADIVGGILVAAGAYNFAAASEFPLVGVNGIALVFHHLMGLPIGVMAIILNIPIAILCYKMLGRGFFFRSISYRNRYFCSTDLHLHRLY